MNGPDPTSQDPNRDPRIGTLVANGYTILWRCDSWVEVMARSGGESFVGRGITPSEAVDRLVAEMFPCALGKRLLEQAIPATTTDGPMEVCEADPPRVDSPASTLLASLVADRPPDTTTARVEPLPTGESEPVQVAPPSASVDPATPRIPVAAVQRREEDELQSATDSLDELLREIRDQLPRIYLSAPVKVRSAVRYWIASARAVEEGQWQPQVFSRVQQVAQLLGQICAEVWPGTVQGLRIDATPYDTTRGRCFTWAEAADHETGYLGRLDAQQSEQGLDEFGYADSGYGSPRPKEVEAVLSRVENELARGEAHPRNRVSLNTLVKSAARLRWIREHRPGEIRWGRAMGTLRRQYSLLSGEEQEQLGQWLDPLYTPPVPWGQLIDAGETASENRYQRLKSIERLAELLDAIPLDSEDPEQLLAWIQEVGAHLPVAEIARQLEPAADRVLALDPLAAAVRRDRRRIRQLQSLLGVAGTTDVDATPFDPEEPGEEPEQITEASRDLEVIRAKVKAAVAGREAILVSNRVDHSLAASLEKSLELSLEIIEATPRRIDAAAERIQNRSIDLVLYATGFAAHKDVNKLAKAAKLAGIPFVKTARSRPLACLLAMARDLGLV